MKHPNTPYPNRGKFEGEPLLTVLAHRRIGQGFSEESFGDSGEWVGWYVSFDFGGKYGRRYYWESPSGFFSEIEAEPFERMRAEYERDYAERDGSSPNE